MGVLSGLFITAFFLIIAILLNPFAVFTHELGHALSALIFTKSKVEMFVGSYGDKEHSLKISLGRLIVFFKFPPPHIFSGLCRFNAEGITYYQNIIITATGSLFTFITAIISCYVALAYDWHGLIKIILFVFVIVSIIELWVNLKPDNSLVYLYDGTTCLSDGGQILAMMKLKALEKKSKAIDKLIEQEQYKKAIISLERIFQENPDIDLENFYTIIISLCLKTKNYEKAMTYYNKIKANTSFSLTANDFLNFGYLNSHFENREETIKNYDLALELEPGNQWALNNKGYQHLINEEYENAFHNLNYVIQQGFNHAYPFNNRGLAKVMLGDLEGGLADIQYSLSLDDKNSYAYMHLGVYYLKKHDLEVAEIQFKKAMELDPKTYNLKKYIAQLEDLKKQV